MQRLSALLMTASVLKLLLPQTSPSSHEGVEIFINTPVYREDFQMNQERSFRAIRRQAGKPDVETFFPGNLSFTNAVLWCEADGYKVIQHEIVEHADDERCCCTIIVTVEQK